MVLFLIGVMVAQEILVLLDIVRVYNGERSS
nr:MAG TPA: hypothetical protein [Crassvirales sp.]